MQTHFLTRCGTLDMGVANSNSDYISKVVIPDAVNTIYIQQTSPTGGKTITG